VNAAWSQLERCRPDVAQLAERILTAYGSAYLATIASDGGPRIHPLTPVVIDGHLCIGVISSTAKRRDLDRDPRCALHLLPGPEGVELSVRGMARSLPANDVDALFARAPDNVRLARDTSMYEILVSSVAVTRFSRGGDDCRPVSRSDVWHAHKGA